MALSDTVTDVLINGQSTGAIDITVSGGTGPYTFAWSTGATTEDITGLVAGGYTVTVTDANGCTITDSYTVTEPTALTVTGVATDLACNGDADGSVDITVSGGVSPYTYSWSNGASTEDLSGLSGGTFSVTVTDTNGATSTTSYTVVEPSALALSDTVTDVLINGQSTGAIDITVSGGTGPYTFAWSTGATTEDITGLVAGGYSVTVTDANGCTITDSYTVTEPTALTVTGVATDLACNGDADGSVDITVSGGVSPYTYSWSNGASTEDLSGLSGGTYSVTVTDANGATSTTSYTVVEPSALALSDTVTDVLINGQSTGAIDITVSGGTGPYTFAWSTGATTEDITGLVAGGYSVTVTDANGCTITDSYTVTEPTALTVTGVATDLACNGDADGSVDITVSGGVSPYTYSWSNGASTEDLSGLSGGTFSVTVTDANGATSTTSYTVVEPSALSLTEDSVVNSNCGQSDGSVLVSTSGGTAPFTYLWSNGDTTEDLTAAPAGSYTLTVTDANGCSTTLTSTINDNSSPTASAVATDALCFGDTTGSVDLTVSGGTGPYTYAWNNGATTEDLSGVAAGTYNVTITDAVGCTTTASAIVGEPTLLAGSAVATDALCNGDSTGSIDLTVSGGTAPFTYAWDNGDTTEDISTLAAGTYNVTITDANGCTATASATVGEPTLLAGSAVATDALCNGDSTGSIDLTVSGGTAPFTYAWNNGDTTEDISTLAAGTYNVTITDANGCTATASATVNEPTALGLSDTVTDVLINGQSTGAIDITVSGGTGPYTFAWSTGATTEDITGLVAGGYSVTVTDANGCTITDSYTVTEPTALTVTGVATDLACNGDADGSVDITVSGGVSPYTYSWSNGASTEDLSGLSGGTFSVTVTDANGATSTTSYTVVEPSALALSDTVTDVLINGQSTGAIDITVSGGTGPYTFAWSTGATTEDITGLVAGGYSVTVTDANGCTITDSYTVTEPTALTVTGVATDLACNGDADGSVDITVSGGVSPYTYSWSNGASTEDLSGLSGGTYSVTVTDTNGATSTTSYTVVEPSALALSDTVTDVLINGQSTGAIDITVSGGTGPYTYAWSTGATTEDITGLVAGGYTVTVTDANGCTITDSYTVTEPTALTVTGVATDLACNGDADGSVDITVSGGVSPYTYSWSNGASTEDLSGLSGGTFSVTVTDANGATSTTSYTVVEPSALSLTEDSVVNSNCGQSDGSVLVSTSGGTAPFTYLWSNGDTTEDLTAAPAGSYTLTVTDANGCSTTLTSTINDNSSPTASAVATDALCFGDTTGSVDLTVSGGTGPYTYAWNNGATTEDLSGVAAGTYNVTITDAVGCTTTASAIVGEPTLLAGSAVATDALCNGDSTGSIDLTVSGGTAPFTYAWDNGDTTEDISTLAAGTYNVTITDANGCTATASATVGEPTLLAGSAVATDALCNGDSTGSIDLTVSGGTAPFTYAWNNGDTTEDISTLAAGTYNVTITDANGCTATASATVGEPILLAGSAVATDALCNGDSTGSIDLTVSGGTAPFTYAWNNGDTTEDISTLAAGTYNVTITDANGCIATASATVGEPTLLAGSAVATDALCNGDSTGSIDLTVTGGTAPFTYAWDNGETTEDISTLAAGTYNVTITDANGCTATASATVGEPILLAGSAVATDALCNGDSTGSIDLTVSGGTAPFTYAWNNGETTEDISTLAAGTYNVTITDANGCTATTSAVVGEPTLLAGSAVATDALCNGDSTGSIDLTVSGGTAPFTYAWSNGETTEDISTLAAGTYNVTITDANGCTATASAIVGEPTLLALTEDSVVNSNCGQSDGSVLVSTSGGTAPFTYLWSNGDTTEDLSAAPAGSYTLTVTDANGCSTTLTSTINDNSSPTASAVATDALCFGDTTGSVDLTVSGGTGPYTYAWNNGATTEDLSGVAAGTYNVTITDAVGCTTTASATVGEPTLLAGSAVATDALCNGAADGSVDLTVSGGTAPFTYAWNNGETTEDISTLAAGTYNVTITDANGCTTTASATVGEPTLLGWISCCYGCSL